MKNLQSECAELVKQDCIVLRTQLVKESKKACVVSQPSCSLCDMPLNDPKYVFENEIDAQQ